MEMKLTDFSYFRVTENVLFGLKDYVERVLYPTYIPLKGTTRSGKENEIEVRVYWRGKPQILPFIILSNKGDGFKENKMNFDADSIINEYVEEIDGKKIAFREKATMGDIVIQMSMVTEDADNRVKLADYMMNKLTSTRDTFIYREPDGFANSLISFVNKGYSATGYTEISVGGSKLEYLYVCNIDIPLHVQYNWIEQIFPGVVMNISTSTGIYAQ